MPPGDESPCKKCQVYPCLNSKDCQRRIDYVERLGRDGMKAVDCDSTYRFLPK